jgi:hypothetical protein
MGTIRRQFLLSSLKLFDVVLMVSCFLLAIFFDLHGRTVLGFEDFLSACTVPGGCWGGGRTSSTL